MAQRFKCSNCGPAGYKVVIVDGGRAKKCNCCGATKSFNRIQRGPAPEFLAWLEARA